MKPHNIKCKIIRILLSSGFLITSSCSMMNPYIDIGDRPQDNTILLSKAIDYANKGKDEYTNALGEQAEFNSYLGIGLTALGAAALGLGITGGSTTAITILGLTGASAYGVGSFLENKPRQRAYILGYNALNCAVEAVLPLNISLPLYEKFSQALHGSSATDGLLFRREETEKAISKVKQIKSPDEAIIRSISAAEALVETAKIAYTNGVSLDLIINNSGNALITSVDRIVGQVNDSINTNQTDLQSIMTIIGGLGGMYSQITTVPQSMTPASDIKSVSAVIQSADTALNELLDSAARLSRTTQEVTAFVNAIVAKKPIEQLKLCGVDPEDIASSIEIDPTGVIEFIQGKAGSTGRIIRGGHSPYSATIASSSAKGITVKQSIPFAPMFVVEASKEAVVGDYAIYVTDGSGHRKFITVRVADESDKGIKKSGNKLCTSPPEAWINVSASEREKIQHALCTIGDGKWGCNTLEKLTQFRADENLSDDSKAISKLLNLTDTQIQKRCGTNTFISDTVFLNKQIEKLNDGIAFNMDGLDITVSKAIFNETTKLIDLELSLDKHPDRRISKNELINEIIKRSEVIINVENVDVSNYEQIKSNLIPEN